MMRIAGLARLLVTLSFLTACLLTPLSPSMAKGRTLIRDTEIESTIRAFAAPLFTAAGLTTQAVRIYIIKDETLNAFVAGGQNLFFNTGLLMKTENPAELIGVIAHEIGHISGGHLARTTGAIRNASNAALLGLILGGATTLLTGRADIGVAMYQGATGAGQATLLQYSRAQESSADHAAVRFLDATGQSSRGMHDFLETLSGEELLAPARRSPYANTHPQTRARINFVASHVAQSSFSEAKTSAKFKARHRRMIAKLAGFLLSPARTFQRYPETDQSVPARYARVIATFRGQSPKSALELLNDLLGAFPEDGYFWELRGQILAESGQPLEARVAYRKALTLLEIAPLVEGDLARAELAINTNESNQAALKHMQNAIRKMPNSAFAWRLLATAQGRNDLPGMMALSLAEEALLRNQLKNAVQQAKRAQKSLKPRSPGWLRSLDIEELSKRRLKDRDR